MDERITAMIPRYSELNKVYTEILSGDGFSFERQKFVSDFYNEYKDTPEFEASVIRLMLEAATEHYTVLLNSLKLEIEKNIAAYESHQPLFDNLDIKFVCDRHADRFDWSIKQQMPITQEYHKELLEVNGSLESIGFRAHTQDEEDWLYKKYERINGEYKREEKKLKDLYDSQNGARHEAAEYLANRFRDTCELGKSLLSVLEKYITSQKKKEESESSGNPTSTKQSAYFPMKLISAIHEACNGKQFEDIPEMDFYTNLNLQPCGNKLRRKPREKARVCYLLFLMSETLAKQDRESWKADILNLLEIDTDDYKSHYKDPVSDCPSDSNQQFAEDMQAIFK